MDKIFPLKYHLPNGSKDEIAIFKRYCSSTSSFDEFYTHDSQGMLLFQNGIGLNNINFTTFTVYGHSIHLLENDDVRLRNHVIYPGDFAIFYKKRFLFWLKELSPHLKFFDFYCRSQIINLNIENPKDFEIIVGELLSNEDNHAYQMSLMGAFLTKLISKFYSTHVTVKDNFFYLLMPKLTSLINEHYREHLSAADYAQKMGCSLSSLEKKVKKATGKSVIQLQQERLLKEAKRLLFKSDSCAKEIAYILGFNDESYFSKWFKKITGLSPLKFKDNLIPALWALFFLIQNNSVLLIPENLNI